ncbi:CU044_2847 family protein [Streptomyces sp. NPDC001978]|uniref:CU044_2847 family protein n=1 Tax=Streptomyces sp. NPDC001978 TaxID=3364627 RepID=UPI0036C3BBBE
MAREVTRVARIELPDGTPVWARISGAEELAVPSGELSYTDTGFADRVEASVESLHSLVTGVARSLAGPLRAVRPDEVSVEFGIELTAKAGKVVGLLADGEAKAAITVTLTWTENGPTDPTTPDTQGPAPGGAGSQGSAGGGSASGGTAPQGSTDGGPAPGNASPQASTGGGSASGGTAPQAHTGGSQVPDSLAPQASTGGGPASGSAAPQVSRGGGPARGSTAPQGPTADAPAPHNPPRGDLAPAPQDLAVGAPLPQTARTSDAPAPQDPAHRAPLPPARTADAPAPQAPARAAPLPHTRNPGAPAPHDPTPPALPSPASANPPRAGAFTGAPLQGGARGSVGGGGYE